MSFFYHSLLGACNVSVYQKLLLETLDPCNRKISGRSLRCYPSSTNSSDVCASGTQARKGRGAVPGLALSLVFRRRDIFFRNIFLSLGMFFLDSVSLLLNPFSKLLKCLPFFGWGIPQLRSLSCLCYLAVKTCGTTQPS